MVLLQFNTICGSFLKAYLALLRARHLICVKYLQTNLRQVTNVFTHWYGWSCVPPFIPILGYNLTCRIDLLSHPNHNGKSSVLRRILLNSLMLLFLRASIFSDSFILNTISLLGVPHNKFCTLIAFISIPANTNGKVERSSGACFK